MKHPDHRGSAGQQCARGSALAQAERAAKAAEKLMRAVKSEIG